MIALAFVLVGVKAGVLGFWLGLRYAGRLYRAQVEADPRWLVRALVTSVGQERARRMVRDGVPL